MTASEPGILDPAQVPRLFGPICAELAPVADAFAAAGHELYLVGGIVRDTLRVGRVDPKSGDIDCTTSARPDTIRDLLTPLADTLWAQGERFGTIGARIGGLPIEVTTYRAEQYDRQSRKPMVTFGDNLDDDLARRDFTINAMAVSFIDTTLSDPFGGLDDLARHRLATPLDPGVSFGDDPLRMMRAARFLARFGFATDPELLAAASRLAPRLSIVSRERIHDELERLLAVTDPGAGLDFMFETGLVAEVLGPGVTESQWRQIHHSVTRVTGQERRRLGLVSPLGPSDADRFLRRLRYSGHDQARTVRGVRLLWGLGDHPSGPAGVRSLVAAAGGDVSLVDDVLAVAATRDDSRARAEALMVSRDALGETEDLADLGLPLDGADVMAELGLAPGPEVGRALDHLRRERIVRGPLSRDVAVAELRRWAASR